MSRKAFRELQLPASGKSDNKKIMEDQVKLCKDDIDVNSNIKTNNTVPTKRSKRIKADNENKQKKTPKETKKSAPKKLNKGKAVKAKCADTETSKSVILNQTRLESLQSPCINNITDIGSCTITCKSFSEEFDLLSSETPSEAYWQTLAEQRLIALEKTAYENERLTDEKMVLQAENMLLKNALDQAETVLKMAGLLE